MNPTTERNREKSEKLMKLLLKGASFSGFKYYTFFTLLFRRNNSVQFNGYELPRDIELTIFTDWWLGSKEEWRSTVDKLAANNIVEPIEPVVSYELTSIMWMEDSVVENVSFHDDRVEIMFKNERLISIMYYVDIDYSWVVEEFNSNHISTDWSVVCEDGEFYVRTP